MPGFFLKGGTPYRRIYILTRVDSLSVSQNNPRLPRVPLSTPLTPGTLYWFVIQEIDTEPSGTWGGETTSGPSVPGGEQLQQYDTLTSGWAPLPENVAFELTGTVAATPLPAALPLFTTGLGVVGLFGWRRKRKAATSLAGA